MLQAIVHAANIQDRDGGAMLMATLFGLFPFLLKLYADGGYQGPEFRRALSGIFAQIDIEIVKRSDAAKGFVVLPKRWVVERTFAWLGRYRIHSRDYERLTKSSETQVRISMVQFMLRRRTRKHPQSPYRYRRRRVKRAA